jgi:hypothetical protein
VKAARPATSSVCTPRKLAIRVHSALKGNSSAAIPVPIPATC